MNRNYGLWMLSLMLLATGCKEHPNDGMKATAPAVRITTVQPTSVGSVQGFSGTVEEMTGSVLSFMVSGTLKNMQVSPGDKVSKGRLLPRWTMPHCIIRMTWRQLPYDRRKTPADE